MQKAPAAPAAAAAGVTARPVAPAILQLSPFLMKLWAIMEDSRNGSMITWSPDGQKVCILDDQRFAAQLLPKYFKHNNLSSFIRQLNLYGFKKVTSMRNETMVTCNNSTKEYQHPRFQKGKPELMASIQRKVYTCKEPAASSTKDQQAMLAEFRAMREQQDGISTKLDTVTRDTTSVLEGMGSLQQKEDQQQDVLSQILQIIMNCMSEKGRQDAQRKRHQNDASEAPRPKNSHPQAHSAREDRETAAVPGHSADHRNLVVTHNNMEGEAGDADGANNGQAVVREPHGTGEEGQHFMNLFISNTVKIDTQLSEEEQNDISKILSWEKRGTVMSQTGGAGAAEGARGGPSLEERNRDLEQQLALLAARLDERRTQDAQGKPTPIARKVAVVTGMNEEEAPRNDLQLIHNQNPMLGEPPTFKMEYDNSIPLEASVDIIPPVHFSDEALEECLGQVYQVDGAPTLLFLDQPVFFENV
uniref:Heat shock factor protein 3-like n=1 Tax=Podarcis muralis TaxID=64176 RepID=A0A670K018_PODMU|nr:heat shock factor protein 3-like isoform X1 [Podarcis muralis]